MFRKVLVLFFFPKCVRLRIFYPSLYHCPSFYTYRFSYCIMLSYFPMVLSSCCLCDVEKARKQQFGKNRSFFVVVVSCGEVVVKVCCCICVFAFLFKCFDWKAIHSKEKKQEKTSDIEKCFFFLPFTAHMLFFSSPPPQNVFEASFFFFFRSSWVFLSLLCFPRRF